MEENKAKIYGTKLMESIGIFLMLSGFFICGIFIGLMFSNQDININYVGISLCLACIGGIMSPLGRKHKEEK